MPPFLLVCHEFPLRFKVTNWNSFSQQGTIIDRIDYNIENVVASVEEGFKQLQKVILLSTFSYALFRSWICGEIYGGKKK